MEVSQTRARIILICACLGSFLAITNGAIVSIALSTFSTVFGLELGVVQWVVLAYGLAICSLLFPCGRLIDVIGARPIFLAGAFIITGISLLCPFVGEFWQLAVLRGIQGVGAALALASSTAIVTNSFRREDLGKAIGWVQSSLAMGGVVAPTVGGALIDLFGWRSIFWLSAAIGAIAGVLALFALPSTSRRARESIDWPGAILLAGSLCALLTALARAPYEHDLVGLASGLLVLSVALFFGFLAVERRAAKPLIDPALFRNQPFVAGNVSSLLGFAGAFGSYLLLAFFLQKGLGYSASNAGLLLVAFPLSMVLVAPISGRVADRFESTLVSVVGMFVSVIGLLWLSRLWIDTNPVIPILCMVLLGLSRGTYQPSNVSFIMRSVPRERIGIASSFVAAMIYFGISLAATLSSGVFETRHQVHLRELPLDLAQRAQVAAAMGFDDTILVAAAVCGVAFLVLLVFRLTYHPKGNAVALEKSQV